MRPLAVLESKSRGASGNADTLPGKRPIIHWHLGCLTSWKGDLEEDMLETGPEYMSGRPGVPPTR